MKEKIKTYRDLDIWKKGIEVVKEIYKLTERFPKHEIYGLSSQIQRAAVSIPSNIAEGYERHYRKEYVHFLRIAKGSLGELETYLLFSRDFKYISEEEFGGMEYKREELSKILHVLVESLKVQKHILS